MDTASSQSGDLVLPLQSTALLSGGSEGELTASTPVQWSIPEALIRELWLAADGDACGITQQEFGAILATLGSKCNHGLPSGIQPSSAQQAAFYRALRLPEVALAQACALGREAAWQSFLNLYRAPLLQAAVAIARSTTLGHDLAESLYAELFGLKEREGCRISPLAGYSGRGSLLAWLRATLAQRHIDRHRRTHREAPLEDLDVPSPPSSASTVSDEINLLSRAVSRTLQGLDPEDGFLLSSYFLDRRTLIEIARLLKVHEATISRRLKRLVAETRKQLLSNLQSEGLRKREAEEALGADPRDIEINMRSLLQTSQCPAFTEQTNPTGPGTQ